ncbi:hypothetical protein EST92_00785 [Streptomyces sp. TM32]|uniref:hypothetical protein n=1 Tax=Streptomyces sp. TM32 TaxID=1652669 RepID=UPI001010E4FF|nr:hypothetical protein [Streptomyces sp. TM32]RXS88398.1 hypothetical protein EST92_00785 [Streptomyces sp. TM32]
MAAAYATDEAVGAIAVLIFLDGLHAELMGRLGEWHEALGDRLPAALGPSSTAGPGGWKALALVQRKARDLLGALATQARDGSFGRGELMCRLTLVEDTFASGLRRIAVPDEISVHCAADLAAAVGALFGLVLPAHRAPLPAHPSPAESADVTNNVMHELWSWAAAMP